MARRMILVLASMLLLVVGLGFVKFQQIRTAMAQGASWQPPPEAVTTIVARRERWPPSLTAIGTAEAVPGDPVVPLQSLDPIYVNFSVPQQVVRDLKVGAEVGVAAESIGVAVSRGRITAINSVVDEATRNVRIQATFRNLQGALRPGMFVEVEVSVGKANDVIALPASAVNFAPY